MTNIEFDHLVPDLLHMFLRISDKLLALLIDIDLENLDSQFRLNLEDINSKPNFKKFIDFLEIQCNISNSFKQENKKFTLRSLVGPEMIRIYENLDLVSMFPQLDNVQNKNILMNEFFSIYTMVKLYQLDAEQVRVRTKNWLELFLRCYQIVHVTPYIHCFAIHLHQFVRLYGDINLFNQQGMEKYNDFSTIHYFRSTNKCKYSYLHQLLIKKSRLESF